MKKHTTHWKTITGHIIDISLLSVDFQVVKYIFKTPENTFFYGTPFRWTRKSKTGRMSSESNLFCACWRNWQINRKQETRGSIFQEIHKSKMLNILLKSSLCSSIIIQIKMATNELTPLPWFVVVRTQSTSTRLLQIKCVFDCFDSSKALSWKLCHRWLQQCWKLKNASMVFVSYGS